MTIEQRLAEIIGAFCADALSFTVNLNVDLEPVAGKVVFVAVNVNPYHRAVAEVAHFSRAHQLTTIPDWHFFTGPVPQLRAI